MAAPRMDGVKAWEVIGPGEILVVAPTDDSGPPVGGRPALGGLGFCLCGRRRLHDRLRDVGHTRVLEVL